MKCTSTRCESGPRCTARATCATFGLVGVAIPAASLVFVVLGTAVVSLGIAGVVTHRSSANRHHRCAAAGGHPEPRPAKYPALIVLDGARPDYFNRTACRTSTRCVRPAAQFTNAFDGHSWKSRAPAGHTTIATGSPHCYGMGTGLRVGEERQRLQPVLADGGRPAPSKTIMARRPTRRPSPVCRRQNIPARRAPCTILRRPIRLGGPDADAIKLRPGATRGTLFRSRSPVTCRRRASWMHLGRHWPDHLTSPDGGEDRLATNWRANLPGDAPAHHADQLPGV